MKILLTTMNARYTHSSLALAYLRESCRDQRWNLQWREFTINDRYGSILAEIYHIRPTVLCFSSYIWNIRQILDICRDYRQLDPGCILVLGGPEVSFASEKLLKNNPAIDVIISGEGEQTLRELLEYIYVGGDYSELAGTVLRSGGDIISNESRPLIDDLSLVPSPYRGDMAFYKDKMVYYETSRGCPFNCSYCISSTFKGVRYFPLDRVKRDLSCLIEQGVTKVKFVDRTFNSNEKRSLELMQFILDEMGEKRTTTFHLEVCADLFTEAGLRFLAQVPPGVFDFEVGVQSTCPQALKAVNRTCNWERLSENISRIKSFNNIHLHLDLIAGLPYEDYHRFGQSFNQVYHLQPDVIQLGFLKLLKGSRIYQEKDQYAYRFQTQPPYQILSNLYMSYDDLCRLEDIEDLVDQYYNSGLVRNSLAYIVDRIYKGHAFKMLEEFTGFWRRNCLYCRPQGRDALYIALSQFIQEEHAAHQERVSEWIKYDYLCNHRVYKVPKHFSRCRPEEAVQHLNSLLTDEAFLKAYVPEMSGKSLREMRKYAHLEYLYLSRHAREEAVYLPVVFIYQPGSKNCRTIQLADTHYT